jgi:nicotinamide-nucleotide amidase
MTNAELLSIGAELLLGETVDTNAAFLGAEMAALGLPLRGVRMLPDDRAVLRDAFEAARARSAVVLATGGLGPTHDDLSREGLADALGEEATEDPELLAVLEERFRAFAPMPATNRRQAMLIPSAEPLPNPIGSAPGWWADRDGVVVVLMPGVPSEMRRMWADQVRPRLAARFGLPPLRIRTVKAFGIGESAMAERLGSLLTEPPDGVEVGIYARDDGVHVRFSTRGDAAPLDPLVNRSREILGDAAYGTDDENLATAALGRLGALGVGTLAS